MKIDLERFGLKDVPVDPDTVFTFAVGPAGFPDCRRFKVFHQEGPQPAVFWLQSLDDVAVAFPIVDPGTLDLEYEIELSDADCAQLELARAEDAAVVIIVYRDAAAGGTIAAGASDPALSGALIGSRMPGTRQAGAAACRGCPADCRVLLRMSVAHGLSSVGRLSRH